MRYSKALCFFFVLVVLLQCNSDTSEPGTTGQGGSMTRFTISNDYLYVADHFAVEVFDIRNDNFEKINEVNVGTGLETIFAKGDYLYLGARDAMYIYSITDPMAPEFIFRYQHLTACDPVVVQGNRAYVTLRIGTQCGAGVNALEIIDITDPYAPVLINNYLSSSPMGLGVQGSLLFLCDGEAGLRVLDISDEENVRQIAAVENMHAYDVIIQGNIATVTGEDGVFQYEFQSSGALTLLSKIPVNRAEM